LLLVRSTNRLLTSASRKFYIVMTVCILLARQRTGTGALGSTLDQHPSIRYFGEVFHSDSMGNPPNYFWHLAQLIKQDINYSLPVKSEEKFSSYLEFLEEFAQSPVSLIDIKYSSAHHFDGVWRWRGILETPELLKLTSQFKVPIIHLTRRNHLKAFVSGLLAEANKVWHTMSSDQVKRRTIHLDPNRTLNVIKKTELEVSHMIDFLKQDRQDVFSIDYDELFSNSGDLSPIVAERLSAFLQVSPFEKTKPVWVKQTSNQLQDVIENYSEIVTLLRETPFGWMLRY
jgi:hypothetical protein